MIGSRPKKNKGEASKASVRASGVSSSGEQAENVLLGFNANAYVLQLMAAGAEKPLMDYIDEQSNKKNLRLYRGVRNGRSWYIIVEGYYVDRNDALAGISKLPNAQRANRPWPKKVASVQQEIKAYLAK